MKTRMELWKEYRDDIQKNNQLEEAIQSSDEKLRILYNRLLKAYPTYEKDFKKAKESTNIVLEEIETIKQYDTSRIIEILDEINQLDKKDSSFKAIDNLRFSSQELDYVIKEIKKGKVKGIEYLNSWQEEEIKETKN